MQPFDGGKKKIMKKEYYFRNRLSIFSTKFPQKSPSLLINKLISH
jgi:hypothetical protein